MCVKNLREKFPAETIPQPDSARSAPGNPVSGHQRDAAAARCPEARRPEGRPADLTSSFTNSVG